MKGKDTMRKRNLWFVPALISFIVLMVVLPMFIFAVREALYYENANLTTYKIAIAVFTAAAFLVNIVSTMMTRTRRPRWVLVAAYLVWSGLLFGAISTDLVEPDLYTMVTAIRISAAVWLGYGTLLATQMLLTTERSKTNGESA